MQTTLTLMEINATTTEISREPSTPLSNANEKDEPNSLDWWLSAKKNEGPSHQRKRSGIRIYLSLARECSEPLLPGSFPATFVSSDGSKMRPDKGLIKALFRAGHICVREQYGELTFQLTEEGNLQFPIAD